MAEKNLNRIFIREQFILLQQRLKAGLSTDQLSSLNLCTVKFTLVFLKVLLKILLFKILLFLFMLYFVRHAYMTYYSQSLCIYRTFLITLRSISYSYYIDL